MSEEPWKLYYWPRERLSGGPGRAEFIRLVFEEAGVPFKEVNENIAELFPGGQWQGFPAFAVPLIQKGNFSLAQTGVICKYLGKKFDLYPTNEIDEWHAEQINFTIHDYFSEGRLAFHGKNWRAPYSDQVEETKPYIEFFRKERLPVFLKHFEKTLAANEGGKGFVVGNKMTYVDLALLHVLRATEAQFPEAWTKIADDIPLLRAFKSRVEARPRLDAYLKSDRLRPFSGNSMM